MVATNVVVDLHIRSGNGVGEMQFGGKRQIEVQVSAAGSIQMQRDQISPGLAQHDAAAQWNIGCRFAVIVEVGVAAHAEVHVIHGYRPGGEGLALGLEVPGGIGNHTPAALIGSKTEILGVQVD